MKNFVIFATLVALIITIGCSSQSQFRSNVHSGNVPEWVVPASLSPAFEKDGKIIAVGFAGRMYNTAKQKEKAAQIAISKIQKENLEATVINVFSDDQGNIFVVAKQKQ